MYNKFSPVAVLILGVYLCLSFTTTGDAIMCYKCKSLDNEKCEDPMGDGISMVMCPNVSTCAKITGIVRVNGHKFTYRNCGICTGVIRFYDGTRVFIDGILSEFYCTICREDYCNSAVNFKVPLIVMVLTFVAARML